jgi:hypothetical protein
MGQKTRILGQEKKSVFRRVRAEELSWSQSTLQKSVVERERDWSESSAVKCSAEDLFWAFVN